MDAINVMQNSRMGFYVHCGIEDRYVRLREIGGGEIKRCYSTSGYNGEEGQIWFARLIAPSHSLVTHHVMMTTPYVLLGTTERMLSAYLAREIARMGAKRLPRGMDAHTFLMKHGPSPNHWNEYIFCGYVNFQNDAVFISGIPDMRDVTVCAWKCVPPPQRRDGAGPLLDGLNDPSTMILRRLGRAPGLDAARISLMTSAGSLPSPPDRRPPPVEQQHDDDHRPIGDLPPGLGDLHHRQDRLQQRDEDHARDRPEIIAASAEDAGAAEHHGGDRGQEIGIAHRLRGLGGVAGEQHAANADSPPERANAIRTTRCGSMPER